MSDVLERLATTIRARRTGTADAPSYTRDLIEAGARKCAQKLGEEAFEVVIAALAEDDAALAAESADLLYHLLVLLEVRRVELSQVLDVLEGRMGRSGLAEKASRKPAAGD